MTLADLQRAAELLAPGSSITVPRDALLEALKVAAVERPVAASSPGCELSVKEVARRLGMKPKFVYQRAAEWDFTRRRGRSLRFDEKGFERWRGRQR